MNRNYEIIRGALILVLLVACTGWILWQWLKGSRDDPRWLIGKWLITIPLVLLCFFAIPLAGPLGPYIIVFCGIVFSILWTPNIVGWLLSPLTSAMDGGDVEPERRPFYSVAQARRNKGQYLEAIAEVRHQLKKFPNDFEGHLLLAAIQAENLNDLPGAELTIQRLCAQSGHPPRAVAAAFNQVADWHIKLMQDGEAAQQVLRKIIERFPDTEMALAAAQRIAHLGDKAALLELREPSRIALPHPVGDVGLLGAAAPPRPAEAAPAQLAAACVKHLEQHPLDSEAREKLARIYGEHYGRLDLATNELEQLITLPNQPAKQVVRWLNLLADLQVECGANLEAARQTLQRIIQKYPDTPAAENARRRLDYLRLGLKRSETSQAVPLGSYEQDLGLKPRRQDSPS